MIMGADSKPFKQPEVPTGRAIIDCAPSSGGDASLRKECPYGADGCPKVEELRDELRTLHKENNVIWRELNDIKTDTASIKASLSSLKWLVFVLVCGATGVGVIV